MTQTTKIIVTEDMQVELLGPDGVSLAVYVEDGYLLWKHANPPQEES